MRIALAASILLATLLSACGENARLPVSAGTGPDPALPPPARSSTVNIAPARGWPSDEMPTPAAGLAVTAFARDLDHPRWLHVLPNGDVLVAETNAQPKPAEGARAPSLMDLVMRMPGAEAAERRPHHPAPRRATGTAVAETASVLLDDLTSPFGMALVGDDLYVADTDAAAALPLPPGATRIAAPGRAGRRRCRRARSTITGPRASPRARTAASSSSSVGSNSDHGENGLDAERGRAAIWRSIPPRQRARSSPRACAIRSASTSSRGPARCGPSSTSATSSAATSSPTI